jgi:hypothetical protein
VLWEQDSPSFRCGGAVVQFENKRQPERRPELHVGRISRMQRFYRERRADDETKTRVIVSPAAHRLEALSQHSTRDERRGFFDVGGLDGIGVAEISYGPSDLS